MRLLRQRFSRFGVMFYFRIALICCRVAPGVGNVGLRPIRGSFLQCKERKRTYAERGSTSLCKGLGLCKFVPTPPSGSRGKTPGQEVRGTKPPSSRSYLVKFVLNFAFSVYKIYEETHLCTLSNHSFIPYIICWMTLRACLKLWKIRPIANQQTKIVHLIIIVWRTGDELFYCWNGKPRT